MSLIEPPDDGIDWSALEDVFKSVDREDVLDVSSTPSDILLDRFHDLDQLLLDLGQVRNPSTTEGRELHSERAAISIELRKRGIL